MKWQDEVPFYLQKQTQAPSKEGRALIYGYDISARLQGVTANLRG
jgi:hypothetical protein